MLWLYPVAGRRQVRIESLVQLVIVLAYMLNDRGGRRRDRGRFGGGRLRGIRRRRLLFLPLCRSPRSREDTTESRDALSEGLKFGVPAHRRGGGLNSSAASLVVYIIYILAFIRGFPCTGRPGIRSDLLLTIHGDRIVIIITGHVPPTRFIFSWWRPDKYHASTSRWPSFARSRVEFE